MKQDLTVTSDTLEAIRDGSREVSSNTSGGANTTLWSNYDNSNQNRDDKDAEITFEYATKMNFNQIKIFFRQDSYSATYPDAKTTQIFVSDTGAADTWTLVDTTETIAQQDNNGVKEYKYDFAPTSGVFVKIRVVNSNATGKPAGFTCTAIAEAELYKAETADFATNTTAELQSLTVDGKAAPAEALTAGSWNVSAKEVKEIAAVGKDNAAVTILPAKNNAVKILIESEDHKTQNTFVINLGVADPADDSKDYTGVITPSAGSTQPNNGTDIDKAFDKKNDTFWHSSWNPSTTNENLYVTMELAEAQKIDAIRYLPKGGNLTGGDQNGRVKTYTVEVSMTGADDSWTKVEITPSTQEWANGTDWKIAQFVQPVEAKFIRFTGVETYGDGGQENKFMSAAEIRVKLAEDEPVVPEPKPTELVIQNQPTKTTYTEGEKFDPTGLKVGVKYDNGEVKDVAEYNAETAGQFTFDPALNTALTTNNTKVTVTYKGKTADIIIQVNPKEEEPKVTGIEVKTLPKTKYTEGDKFDPTGLVLTVKYDKGEDKEVAYGDATKADFTFSPSLDTALKTSDEKVTVTYAGKTAEIGIEVKADTPVEPEKPTVDKIAVKKVPAKTTYKAGETFDPSGLVLTVTMSDKTTKEVAYGDETAKDFVFNPTLDTALTEGMNKVDVTYAGKTAEIGIEVKADTPVEPEKPTVEKVEIKANPAKTEYKAGETFDPTGMSLTVTMSDGTTKVVAYGPETAKDFSFNPSLNTKLTADTKKVTVTYGGQSADVAVSVKADPSEDKKPNTEKPDKGGAVQTGDNFNVTLLIGLVVLAGAVAGGAALTIFKRNKRK